MEDLFRLDVRVRERLLGKGLISAEEVQKHVEALPDLEAEAESIGLEQPALTSLREGA